MKTNASLHGHPVHPMLVIFPLALFTTGFAALLGYLATTEPLWFQISYLAMLVGGAVALVAATFGLVDLVGLPRDSRAKTVGVVHGAVAVVTTVLFLGAGLSMRFAWHNAVSRSGFSIGLPLVLSIVGFAVLLLAGALGWQLVGAHHVGVSPVPGHSGPVLLAGRLARAGVGHPAESPAKLSPVSSNAVALVRTQHAEIDELFGRAIAAAMPAERSDVLFEIGNRFEAHALMEEKVLYPTFSRGASASVFADYARDHQHIRAALAAMCRHPERVTTADIAAVRELVRHHVYDEEEGQLLPLIERTLSKAQLDELGAAMEVVYAELMQHAPWRALASDARHAAWV